MRPANLMFPDRATALEEKRCVAPPMGCGQPTTVFRDAPSAREYEISRLCQPCQDKLFEPKKKFRHEPLNAGTTPAFLAGSHMHGQPTPKSDVDLVVLVEPDDYGRIINLLGGEIGKPLRLGKLNLILTQREADYDAWWNGVWEAHDKSAKLNRPLTRDEAVEIYIANGVNNYTAHQG